MNLFHEVEILWKYVVGLRIQFEHYHLIINVTSVTLLKRHMHTFSKIHQGYYLSPTVWSAYFIL